MLRWLLKDWEDFGAELILGSVQGVFLSSEASLKQPVSIPGLGCFVGWRWRDLLHHGQARAQPCLPVAAVESPISSPFRVNIFEKREVRTAALGFAGAWVR